jgi:dTDP-4-amino-4,6-dideoxygalactose transaminase
MDKGVMLDFDLEILTFYRGRVGLSALLKAYGLGRGDQVAIQAFTCLAVPEAVLASDTRPLFIDIEAGGFNMNADDLESKLTPQTKAIVVQHTYGIPADMDRILRIAAKHGIPIIEDCCHTLTSRYKGRTVGSFGMGSFYSFEWGKPVVAGIGGSVRINNQALLEKAQARYTSYRSPDMFSQTRIELQYCAFSLLYRPRLYWPIRSLFHSLGSLGFAEGNYNPVGQKEIADDFSFRMAPAVRRRLAARIQNLKRTTLHSQWVSDQYRRRIDSVAVSHPCFPKDCDTIFARYPLSAKNKHALLSEARRAQVELAEWYATPVHPLVEQDLPLVHYRIGSCPNAEARCKEVVTLPVHSTVKQSYIDRTVSFLNGVDS